MPRAGDAFLLGQLPQSHSPLDRVSWQPPDIDISIEDLLDMWRQWLVDIAFPLIEELTGLDLTVLAPLLGGFTSVEGFIEMLLSSPTMILGIIAAVADAIGLDFTDPNGFLGSLVGGLSEFLGLDFGGLLDGGSPLNALNLFNLGNLLGVLNIGNLSNKPQNMLDNSDFREAISLAGGGIWTYDSVDGKTVPGCASTTANGVVPRILRSNAVEVAEGDELDLGVSVKWSGLAYTGTAPIKLQVVHLVYDPVTQAFIEGATVDAVSVASPGANQSTWLDWLDDDYVVPAGVTHICLQLYVGANATAGTVKFDDGLVLKTGLLQMGWVGGLLEQFLDIFGVFGNTTGGLPGLSTGMALLQNLVSNLVALAGLAGFDLDDLNKSPMLFNPSTFLSTFIANGMNPLNVLQDNIIRDFTKNMMDQLASILRFIPIVGNDLADSLTQFATSMEAQNEVVVGTAAGLSQLAAAMGEGTPDADDFERTALGPNWRVITSAGGTATLDGSNLVMSHDDDTDYILLKTDKFASGDYQTVEISLGSAPGWNTILLDTARGHNDGWVRCSDFTTWATRTGVRVRWTAQNRNVEISAWNAGVKVATIFSGSLSEATAGSRLKLEAGVLGVPRQYIVRINGGIVKDVAESGTASQLGAGFRRRGLGGATEQLGIPPLAVSPDPGKVKTWTATG